MEVRFHKRVQNDLNEALDYYYEVSLGLADDFYAEFKLGVARVLKNPHRYPFGLPGLRRCNLGHFPFHFLYDIRGETIRIWVLRHDHRRPEFGSKRFTK